VSIPPSWTNAYHETSSMPAVSIASHFVTTNSIAHMLGTAGAVACKLLVLNHNMPVIHVSRKSPFFLRRRKE
jgi:hypothetical protein